MLSLSKGTTTMAFVAALGAKDLDDLAVVLDGAAVGGDRVGLVVEQDDGVGLVGVLGEFLLGGGANPVGD